MASIPNSASVIKSAANDSDLQPSHKAPCGHFGPIWILQSKLQRNVPSSTSLIPSAKSLAPWKVIFTGSGDHDMNFWASALENLEYGIPVASGSDWSRIQAAKGLPEQFVCFHCVRSVSSKCTPSGQGGKLILGDSWSAHVQHARDTVAYGDTAWDSDSMCPLAAVPKENLGFRSWHFGTREGEEGGKGGGVGGGTRLD